MLHIAQTALTLGCVYSLVALALFLSYRVLDIADLTTDGCFVFGMALSVSAAAAGHPVTCCTMAPAPAVMMTTTPNRRTFSARSTAPDRRG